jgi:hypothetical protein
LTSHVSKPDLVSAFTVFEGDARVPALHARKLAAALQHATSAAPGDRPILLRREYNVGHTTRAVSRSIPLWLDQLGFFADNSGSARTWTAPGCFRPGTAGSLSIRAMVSAVPVRTWPVIPTDPAATCPGVSSMNKASPGSAAGRSRAAVQMPASGLAGGIAEFVGTGTPRDHVGL